MLTLYKFRSLGDQNSLERAEEILRTGEFWCSRFWELNDPMEGVFLYVPSEITDSTLSNIFSSKAKHVICSFSGKCAFRIPTMWGYYANGFRGIAVEIEVGENEVHKIKYSLDVASWLKGVAQTKNATMVNRILTTKLRTWRTEDEYRFLSESNEHGRKKIGRIKAVHFGLPYCDVGNSGAVLANSRSHREHVRRVRQLEEVAKDCGISCFAVRINGTEVISEPLTCSDAA